MNWTHLETEFAPNMKGTSLRLLKVNLSVSESLTFQQCRSPQLVPFELYLSDIPIGPPHLTASPFGTSGIIRNCVLAIRRRQQSFRSPLISAAGFRPSIIKVSSLTSCGHALQIGPRKTKFFALICGWPWKDLFPRRRRVFPLKMYGYRK